MTQAFNLSQLANNVNTSGLLNAAAGLYNQTPVANGGTGVATVASGNLLVGAGTSAMTALAGTNTNDVVTWNGTTWTSAASAGGGAPIVRVYTTPGTWTKPATVKGIKVTVVGGGGGGGSCGAFSPTAIFASGGGGAGGTAIGIYAAPALPGPQPYTVGSVTAPSYPTLAPGITGGTSSFGVAPFTVITAVGGGGGAMGQTPNPNGVGGVGGAASGGTLNLIGGAGTCGVGISSNVGSGGTGGSSLYGGGGAGGGYYGPTQRPGTVGGGYGAGGGGSTSSSSAPTPAQIPSYYGGFSGSVGIVIVEEFY